MSQQGRSCRAQLQQPGAQPYAVGLYITSAYWFTASTSFANPAVAIARAFTNTFSGIRPVDVPPFVLAELAGALLGAGLMGWLLAAPVAVEQERRA